MTTASNWQAQDDGHANYSRPFRNHPHVFRAISAIANAAGSVELKLAHKNSAGDDEDITSGIEYETFRNPSSDLSTDMFTSQIAGWMQMAPGEAFIEVIREGAARRLALRSPEAIDITPRDDGSLRYLYQAGNQKREIPEDSIIHIKQPFNPYDPIRGMGPLQAAACAYRDDLDVRQYNRNTVLSGGVPAGFVSVKTGWPTPEQQAEFKAAMDKVQSKNQRIVLIGDGTWQASGRSPAELLFIELRQLSFKEICGVFGVPPQMLGDFERDQADAFIQMLSFYLDTMRPLLRLIADVLTLNLWKLRGVQYVDTGTFCYFDDSKVPAIVRMTQEQQSLELRMVDNATMTRNEFRAQWKVGDPLPWGDDPTIPLPAMPAEAPNADPADDPNAPTTGKSVEDHHATLLEQHAFRLEVIPHEQRLAYVLGQVYDDIEKKVRAGLKAVSAPNVKITDQDESIRHPFDVGEIAARIANDATPILRATQNAGGLRGLKLARQYNRTFNVNARPAVEYLTNQTQQFAVEVSQVTWKKVVNTLRDGVAKGEAYAQLVDRVKKAMDVQRSLAGNTAQTEVNAAFNGGTDLGLQQSEVVLTKKWLTGPNPRPDHAAANGQEVKVNQKFVVGNESISFPGDPSASNAQRCNCNCSLGIGKLVKP
jgi:HK97 family phage portal protein